MWVTIAFVETNFYISLFILYVYLNFMIRVCLLYSYKIINYKIVKFEYKATKFLMPKLRTLPKVDIL